MMKKKKLNFIANARLKDVVGRDLINDDNVAIIELIKNAKDAGSNRVKLHFTQFPNEDSPLSILVQDFGKGMSAEDIEYKWLNIAYSEKKGATPNATTRYAGSKGIGRFSCDRLGEQLVLYTKTKRSELLRLSIDWREFEIDDQKKEIGTIKTELISIDAKRLKEETGLASFSSGTILHISNLRSEWTKDKLIRLKNQLEKFAIDPQRKFVVHLKVDRYENEEQLNGVVENKIFEKLTFRTTSIISSINKDDGDTVETKLIHDGSTLFTLKEKNPYANLKRVRVTIFYLAQPAKAFFKVATGYRNVDFGSMFLFLNGFRVMPYGQKNDDWLGLDKRRAQGHMRFLGTREIVGFIEVDDRDSEFQAVSSREGLVNNSAFKELASSDDDVQSKLDDSKIYSYFHKVFRKLEKFVVEGLDWDRITDPNMDEELLLDPTNYQYKTDRQKILSSLDSIITIRSPSEHIVDVDVNYKNVIQHAKEEVESYEEFVDSLQEKFEGTSAAQLTPAEKRDLSRFVERQKKAVAAKTETAKQLEQDLVVETKRRLFAEFEKSADTDQIINMHHQTRLLAGQVFKQLNRVLTQYRQSSDSITIEKLIDVIEKALFNVDKIRKVSDFASKASFNLATNRVTEDIVLFIKEYVEDIQEISSDLYINVVFSNPKEIEFKTTFRPLEVMMLVDNAISNAAKAKARHLRIVVEKRQSRISVKFIDDGIGLPADLRNSDLFEKGITTTNGSGIGLSHIKQIAEEVGGSVRIRNNLVKGVTLALEFDKT